MVLALAASVAAAVPVPAAAEAAEALPWAATLAYRASALISRMAFGRGWDWTQDILQPVNIATTIFEIGPKDGRLRRSGLCAGNQKGLTMFFAYDM
jgi:hypothetical protein